METFEELKAYLKEECFAQFALMVGSSKGYEGYVVWQDGPEYHFGYSERGETRVEKTFLSEKEAIAFALQTVEKNKWSKAHMVAFLWDKKDVLQAENELRSMNISFERNDIPNYRKGEDVYRIFVFGKDVLKLSEFENRYIRYSKERR